MNPFLADAVANADTAPRPDPDARPWRTVRASAARRLIRHVGALAVATGLAFLPLGAASAMDLNTATPEQLQTLRGIGGKTAGVIVQERERGGRFTSMQDLSDRVRGIGPKRLESLQAAGLTVAAPAASPPASSASRASSASSAPPASPASASAPPASRSGRR